MKEALFGVLVGITCIFVIAMTPMFALAFAFLLQNEIAWAYGASTEKIFFEVAHILNYGIKFEDLLGMDPLSGGDVCNGASNRDNVHFPHGGLTPCEGVITHGFLAMLLGAVMVYYCLAAIQLVCFLWSDIGYHEDHVFHRLVVYLTKMRNYARNYQAYQHPGSTRITVARAAMGLVMGAPYCMAIGAIVGSAVNATAGAIAGAAIGIAPLASNILPFQPTFPVYWAFRSQCVLLLKKAC